MAPAAGRSNGGEAVTISGTNLANPISVTFGGSAATITGSNSASITITTPPAPSLGTVTVVVTTVGGTATVGFRYDLGYPLTVTATATATQSVHVTWSSVPGAGKYEVVRSADGSTFSTVDTVGVTSLDDSGVGETTAYLYKVRAASGATFGSYSAPDLATTVMLSHEP